jgi:hypothetical protein
MSAKSVALKPKVLHHVGSLLSLGRDALRRLWVLLTQRVHGTEITISIQ